MLYIWQWAYIAVVKAVKECCEITQLRPVKNVSILYLKCVAGKCAHVGHLSVNHPHTLDVLEIVYQETSAMFCLLLVLVIPCLVHAGPTNKDADKGNALSR